MDFCQEMNRAEGDEYLLDFWYNEKQELYTLSVRDGVYVRREESVGVKLVHYRSKLYEFLMVPAIVSRDDKTCGGFTAESKGAAS